MALGDKIWPDETGAIRVGWVGLGAMPVITPGTSVLVSFDASVQSAALTATVIRLCATTDCHVAIAANPTAVADGTCMFLPANSAEYIRITSGQKVAAIKDASAGKLYITIAA